MILPPPKKPPKSRFEYALETLSRLPLAESFYDVWAYLADAAALSDIWAKYRGRCYEDQLTFAQLVGVFADALTRHHGSGAEAIAAALTLHQLPTKPRAVYAKLGRLPLPLAEAFLSVLTARLRQLFPPQLLRNDLPPCLAKLTIVVLDGKKIKKVAKRLLAVRGRPGKVYGGHLVAAYLPADGLVVAMAADPDGEANDIRLMPRVMPLARGATAGLRLWVVDSQFCDLDQPALFCQDGDHMLARFTLRNSFEVDPARPARHGLSKTGQEFVEDCGWMGAVDDERRRYLRRITLKRPGEKDVILVTSLLDEEQYPAVELLETYLLRWQIENVYQQITEVFGLKRLIGCTPEATVFQAALCLVIYNVVQLIRGYVAQQRPQPVRVEELSAEQIFKDMHKQLVSLHTVLEVEELLEVLQQKPLAAEQVRQRLAQLLGATWSDRWLKAKPKKRRPAKPEAKEFGAHTSVHKLLQQAKLAKKDKTSPVRLQ
jgi:Transposase DDE domain